ncbi:Myo-inositol-1-monophosphatase [Coleophoma crateriformis]|uniref:Inositol-1-monophosphatase n=1 Tax=Coleophoma crateriformis TaxID=565419 RepID=A0A3D8QID5_9HELO|nr:Myo-inositol-1-monophosphatase [Coleophoma crateriformis]
MAEINLQEVHDLLVSIAHEAGKMIMSATPSYLSAGEKKNSADLVTETDQAVEAMVSSRLQTSYPQFSFIGEETFKPGVTKLTDAPTFIVDPIDGTTNFVHAFPAFCISLGFVVKKVPSVGVIYNPFLGELYTAIKGQGAYISRNGAPKEKLPLKQNPEPLKDLSTCLVGAEWGSDRTGSNFAIKCAVFAKLAASKEDGGAMVHSLRCMGSAALNIAAVATGQQDVFWEGGCWAWDVAAGWCLLSEAGGIMAGGNPGDWDPAIDGRKYLAVRAAPEGQKAIVEEMWAVIGDGRLEYES